MQLLQCMSIDYVRMDYVLSLTISCDFTFILVLYYAPGAPQVVGWTLFGTYQTEATGGLTTEPARVVGNFVAD